MSIEKSSQLWYDIGTLNLNGVKTKMEKLNGYMAGVNFGHWISQYGTKSHEHFSTYTLESDVARLKEWGMDHVRLPVDYFLFEDDDNEGVYKESGLVYIDNCLAWCKKYGINVVLDLHHAPGFFFSKKPSENTLMTDESVQQHFINIWKFFAERYKDYKDELIFELLNELVWENSDPWNELWPRVVAAIHSISPDRRIIVGGNYHNSVNSLADLKVTDNPYVIYTFHMYEPYNFTHQQAPWEKQMYEYKTPIKYPVSASAHPDLFRGNVPEKLKKFDPAGKDYLRDFISPAVEFIKKTGKPLYCGEYGVISYTELESAIKWHQDLCDLFLEYGIGRAVWSYRGFALVTDENNEVISEELIRAISKK